MFEDDDAQLAAVDSSVPGRRPLAVRIRPVLRPAALVGVLVGAAITGQLATSQITVHSGDTLTKIAKENGTTVDALVASNGIDDPNFIRVGQVLDIPASGELRYTVRAGDTLSAIAKRFGTSVPALASRNGISDANRIVAGTELVVPNTATTVTTTTVRTPTILMPNVAPTTTAARSTMATAPTTTAAAPPTATPTTTAVPTTTAAPTTTVDTTPPVTAVRPGVVSTVWVVQPGDTVSSIARRLGVDPARLAAANALSVDTPLSPGQRLIVP